MLTSRRKSLGLAPALVLGREVVQLLRVVGGVRVFDHHQPLSVLGIVLTGQGVPYELRFLGDTEALRQCFGHLLRRVAVGQYQYVP